MSLNKRKLFEVWHKEKIIKHKNLPVLAFVSFKFGVEECANNKKYNTIRKNVNRFNSKVAQMWKEYNRTLKVFEERHHQWLDENIKFFRDISESDHSQRSTFKRFQ